MGLFDKVLGGTGSHNVTFNKREAFAGILLATVAADGYISDEEVDNFNAVIARMQLYKEQSGADFRAMIDKLIGLLKKHGADFLLEKSITSLPPELRDTTFAVVADLVFADGVVELQEKQLLEKLHKALAVPDDLALKILEVAAIKNKG